MPDLPAADPLPPPWERLPGETNRWFGRFERFRLAGSGRSVLAVFNADKRAQGQPPSRCVPGAWAQAAKRWHWRQRAEAWDEHQRQQARQAHADDVREINERHVREARALQAKAVERLRALRPEELGAADVLRYCSEATKLERLALGEPEVLQRQELTGQGGGPLQFCVEDAVAVFRELEEAPRGPLQQDAVPAPPPGSPPVP
jgi:hypothetical protein